MTNKKGVVKVSADHIAAGIKKYEGAVDTHISSLIKSAGLQYTPYIFKDGRILLVLPNNVAAFLYADKKALFETLSLTE